MRYVEGDWLAVAATGGGALLPADFGAVAALAVWQEFKDQHSFSDVLQRLVVVSGASLVDLPSFAIAVIEGGDAHLAVRGPLCVAAQASSGDITVTGENVTTWREERVRELSGLRLSARPSTPRQDLKSTDGKTIWWPVGEGIVRAGALELLTWSERDDASLGEVPEETVVAEIVAPAPDDNVQTLPPPPPPPSVQMPPPPPPPSPVLPVVVAPEQPRTGDTTLLPDDETDDDASLHSTTFFADMFAEPADPSAGNSAVAAVAGTDLDDDHDGMTVIGLSAAAAPDDDHDGMTVLSFPGGPPSPPVPQPDVVPPMGGPTVLARICLACGTPNPTQRVACRACGTSLSGDAIRIPRPRLGTLVLPSGEPLPIEHPVVVGRRPEVARFSDDDIPVVVRVDDPHISSTHLKIDLEDWSVLVTNLGLNGTVLRRPGQPDRSLGNSETVLAQVGDVYDLGSGTSLTVKELA